MHEADKPFKIGLYYGHVATNIGDLAINRGQIDLLRAAFPDAIIRVVLFNARKSPYLERATKSLDADNVEIHHFSTDDKMAPYYAINPGQLLDDCHLDDARLIVLAAGEHLFNYAAHRNYVNLFWRTLPAFAARSRGIRCVVMPSTFGPFESTDARALLKSFLAPGVRVAARETRSVLHLDTDANDQQIETLLDPAFFIATGPGAPAEKKRTDGGRVIGLVMRAENWGIRLSKPERERLKLADNRDSIASQFALALGQIASESDFRLQLFAQTKIDKELADAVIGELARLPDAVLPDIISPESVDEYIAALDSVDGVVASRFHALILSQLVGKPCYGVYFDAHGHKIPGLFELFGRSDCCCSLSELAPSIAARQVSDFFAGTDELPEEFIASIDALRRQTQNWLEAEWSDHSTSEPEADFLTDLSRLWPMALFIGRAADKRSRATLGRLSKIGSQFDTSQKQVEDLQSQHESTQKKLAAADRRYEELEARLASMQAEREAEVRRLKRELETDKERLTTELDAAQALAKSRERDLAVLRSRSQRDRRVAIEKADLAEQARQDLLDQIDEIGRSESFRLGYAIVRIATAPIRLVKRLRGIPVYSRRRFGRAAEPEGSSRSPEPKKAPELDEAEFKRLHAAEGVEGVIDSVRERNGGNSDTAARALIQASRLAMKSGITDAEYPIVLESLNMHRSDRTLRAMYWATQRAGKVRDAWNILREIEEFYGATPEPGQEKWLQKARSGPIMNIGLLDEIVLASERAFEARPDTVCYVLHNSLPYSSGGYATRAQGMTTGLRAAGIEVTGITRPGYPFDVKPDLEGTLLPDEDLIDEIRYLRLWEPRRGGSALSRYVRGAADSFELKFRQLRPALVMAASAHLSALPALIAARRLGVPFIYEVRGFWEITRLSREPEFATRPYFHVQKLMEAEVANLSDHVFTLTTPMKQELVDRGVLADKISLLPNSCDPERFVPRDPDLALADRLNIPPGVPVIGYVGTFVQYEGLEDLARACAMLRGRNVEFRLVLVGNEDTSNKGRGPITDEIERITVEGQFDDWVIMPGRVPHEEVESYYSIIDIAPFPRKPQPVTEMVSPMKPLEALSMEKAIVVSSVRALAEFVEHGETGLIFEKGSVDSLADTLETLIRDSDLRTRIGKAARQWVIRERTWKATAHTARDRIRQTVSENPVLATSSKVAVLENSKSGSDDRSAVFKLVRGLYDARRPRGKSGKRPFPNDDWARTRLVFEMIEGARTVIDVGIGQAQLVNMLARCADVTKVYGFDFRDYNARIDPPTAKNFEFRSWDVTKPLQDAPEPVDIVVAAEILEHIDTDVMPDVYDRLRRMSSSGTILITVPYREKEPLYHHNLPHGHKQSFDDEKLERLFGPACLYSHFKEKWYFVLVSDELTETEFVKIAEFSSRVRNLLQSACVTDVRTADTA